MQLNEDLTTTISRVLGRLACMPDGWTVCAAVYCAACTTDSHLAVAAWKIIDTVSLERDHCRQSFIRCIRRDVIMHKRHIQGENYARTD